MDKQVYIDTIEALHADNEKLRAERDNYKLANQIRLQEGAKKQARKGAYFTKVFITTTRELIKSGILNSSEQALLFCLLPYIQYQTNFVVNEQDQRLNITEIAKIVGMSERHTRRVFNDLGGKGVINKVEGGRNTHIQLSSKYFYRGKT